jgi:hypothetical protein
MFIGGVICKAMVDCGNLWKNVLPPSLAGDLQRQPGDVAQPTGGGQSPAGGGLSPAGDHHRYSRLYHVYTKGLVSESVVLPDSMTDHRPVVTTVRTGSHVPGGNKTSLLKETKF